MISFFHESWNAKVHYINAEKQKHWQKRKAMYRAAAIRREAKLGAEAAQSAPVDNQSAEQGNNFLRIDQVIALVWLASSTGIVSLFGTIVVFSLLQ